MQTPGVSNDDHGLLRGLIGQSITQASNDYSTERLWFYLQSGGYGNHCYLRLLITELILVSLLVQTPRDILRYATSIPPRPFNASRIAKSTTRG